MTSFNLRFHFIFPFFRPVLDAVVKTTKYLVGSLFLIYVVFPSVMKLYPRIQEKLIFLNFGKKLLIYLQSLNIFSENKTLAHVKGTSAH